MPSHPSATIVGIVLGLAAAASAPANAQDGNVDLPRYPAVSPDGSRVVFTWRGDLWLVPTAGGRAARLTSHPADDLQSAWSPDGERLAYTSDRDGFMNIHVMNVDGTDVRQVTDIDRPLTLGGFGVDEDGEPVITFHATLSGDVYRSHRPYQVSPAGGDLRPVHGAFGSQPIVSPNGREVLFTRGGLYSGWERRRSRGPETMDLFVYERGDASFRRLTSRRGNDGDGRWVGNDTIYYLSDRDDARVNLYRMDADEGERTTRAVTSFAEHDVAGFDVSADGSIAVVQVWDRLYAIDLDDRDGEPVALVIHAAEDELDDYRMLAIGGKVSEAALSPDGQVMAYVAYGEVYVRNVDEKSPTRRVTRNSARERDVAWAADGVRLYFVSDRDGTDSIYAATVALTRTEVKDAFDEATGRKKKEKPEADPEGDEDDDDDDEDDDHDPEPDPEPAPPDEPGAADMVSGVWDATTEHPQFGEFAFTLTLKLEDDGLVTGTMEAPMAAGPLTGFFDATRQTLALTVAIPDGPVLEFDLVIDDDTMTGTATADGTAVDVTAHRSSGPPKAPGGDDEKRDAQDPDQDPDDPPLPPELDPKRWHDAVQFTIDAVVETADNDRRPQPSPDGRGLSFKRGLGDVVILDLEDGTERVLYEGWDAWTEWRYSPDSRWVAFARSDMNFNADVFIVPADGSADPINITRHPDNDQEPRWSADGKILSFVSERINEEFDVWMVYLDRDLEALTPLERDAYFKDAAKAAKKRKPVRPRVPEAGEAASDGDADTAGAADEPADDEPPDEDEPDPDDALELEDAYLRVRRVTQFPGDEQGHELTPAGDLVLFNGTYGERGLYAIKWDGSERKRLAGPVSLGRMTLGGDKAVFVSGGRAGTVKPAGGQDFYDISDRIRIDLEAEASQKFHEAMRVLGEQFYHPTMKGLDWPGLVEAYHALARRTRTAEEFAWVGHRLLGELTASHLGIRPVQLPSPNRTDHGRLGTTHEPIEREDGTKAYRVTAVVPHGPADTGPMALLAGDVVTAIELEPFTATDTIESRLAGRIGDETIVTIERDGRELKVLLTPTSFNALRQLEYRAWRRRNAALVAEWSNGLVGYIHIQGMGQSSLDVFERDLFAAADGRAGLLVDVRNNGGGWTTDRLLSSIMVRPHAYTIPRGADPDDTGHYPQDRLFIQRYTLPVNLLCNEKSFSNAEICSHAFKTLERGTLVGQETWGGVISTGGFQLIDGTLVRLPFRGWHLLDGTDMENHGAVPDLLVEQTPEAEAAGEDEQLRTALDDLLERVE